MNDILCQGITFLKVLSSSRDYLRQGIISSFPARKYLYSWHSIQDITGGYFGRYVYMLRK